MWFLSDRNMQLAIVARNISNVQLNNAYNKSLRLELTEQK